MSRACAFAWPPVSHGQPWKSRTSDLRLPAAIGDPSAARSRMEHPSRTRIRVEGEAVGCQAANSSWEPRWHNDPVEQAVLDSGDGLRRCPWGIEPPEYRRYHDEEWGRPVIDDVRIFENLCLEGFQSGLSWLTILRKRDGFRRAF